MSARTSKPVRRDPARATPVPKPSESLSASSVWTHDRIRALGAFTTLMVASQILGILRATAYNAVHADQIDGGSRFPVPVTRVGRRIYRVPVPALLALLYPEPGGDRADTGPPPPATALPASGRAVGVPGGDWMFGRQSRVDPPGRNPR